MEKDKILQIAVPAVAVAAIILVIALIVNGSSEPTEETKRGSGIAPPIPKGKAIVAEVPIDSEGVGMTKPDLNAAEWKDIGEGLKIWDVKVGEGNIGIATSDDGLWHYTGWLPGGGIFDSSLKGGEAIPFKLTEVIAGWTRGLAGMKAGGIRRLNIPSPLAYGSSGRDPIPPNTDLVFEVKLLRISR